MPVLFSHTIRCALILLFAWLLVGAGAACAQSAAAVVQRMIDRYETQMRAVDDYTIETDSYTAYYKKFTENGQSGYKSYIDWGNSDRPFSASGQAHTPNFQSQLTGLDEYRRLAETATYGGTETVAGREAHVLLVDDLTTFMPEGEEAPPEGTMRFYVDAGHHVPLRIEYAMTVEQDGQTRAFTPVVHFEDYREVEGLLVPYRMRMEMENLSAALSPEDREEARRGLEEMEKQMSELSGLQKRLMERTLKNQIEKLREIIEGGMLSFDIEVQDVKVNTGLDDALFAGSSD